MSGNPLLDLAAKEGARKAVKKPAPADPLDKAFQDLGVKGGLKTVQKAKQKEDSLRPNGLGDARRVAQSRLKVDPATHDVVESALYMNAVDSKGNLIQPDTPETDIRKYSVHPLVRDAIIKEFNDNPQAATEKYARQRGVWRTDRKELRTRMAAPQKGPVLSSGGQLSAEDEGKTRDFELQSLWEQSQKNGSGVMGFLNQPGIFQKMRDTVAHHSGALVRDAITPPGMKNPVSEWIGGVAGNIIAGTLDLPASLEFAGDDSNPVFDRVMAAGQAALMVGGANGLIGAVEKVAVHTGLPVSVVKEAAKEAEKTFDREAFAKQLQSQEGPLEVGRGAVEVPKEPTFTRPKNKPTGTVEIGRVHDGPVYRQTTLSNFLDGSYRDQGNWWSTHPDTALGQQGNTGVVVEFAPSKGGPGKVPNYVQFGNKPAAQVAWEQGHGEFRPVHNPLFGDAKSVTVEPGVKPANAQEKLSLITLESRWNKEVLPDGSVKYTNPKFAEPTASTTAEPSTVETPPVVEPQAIQTETPVHEPPVVPPTVEPPPQTGAQGPETPSGTTFLHAEAQTYSDELGADLSKTSRSWGEALAESRKQGIAENALNVAEDAAKKRRPLSDVEKIGMGERLHQIRKQRTDIAQKIATGTASDVEKAMYDALTKDGAKIYEAAFKAGSESGRSLNAQKAWIEGPIDDIHLTAKWTSKLGRDLTETESAAVKNLSEKHAELQKSLDDALARISRLEAEKSVRKNPRAGTSFTRTVTRDQAVTALERLGTVVQPGQLGSGLGGFKVRWNQEDSEALRTVVKYVYEGLAEKGIHTLESVKSNVRALMPDREIDDVTLHQAIKDALGSEGRTINRGRAYGEDVLQSGHWALKDPDVAMARAKLEGVKQEAATALNKALEDEKFRNARGLEFARLHGKDVLQSVRTVMTTMDDSAIGRQSWLIGLTNPRSWAKGVLNHVRGITHKGYEAAVEDLRAGSGYELGQQSGLKLRTVVGEEMYGGRMLQHIPVVKQVVNTSERLFDIQSDFAAQDAFDSMVRLTGAGREEAKVYADFVNTLTGKTNLRLGDADPLFFAPKFAWSRFKALNAPGYIAKAAKAGFKDGGLKQGIKAGSNIAYQYAKAGAMLTGLFAAAHAGGWKVSSDPSSSDFGKIRKGKIVVDLTAGEGQIATFAYRLWNSAMGKPRYFRGAPVSFLDELVTFGRKKLAPVPGALTDLGFASANEVRRKRNNMGEGRDVTGQDVKAGDEVGRSVVPLGISQQIQMSKQNPSTSDRFWTALGDFFGYGTSYYAPKDKK